MDKQNIEFSEKLEEKKHKKRMDKKMKVGSARVKDLEEIIVKKIKVIKKK